MMMVVNSQGIDRKDDIDNKETYVFFEELKETYVFFEELGDETCIAEQVSRLTGRFSRRTSVQLEEMGYLIQKEHAKI